MRHATAEREPERSGSGLRGRGAGGGVGGAGAFPGRPRSTHKFRLGVLTSGFTRHKQQESHCQTRRSSSRRVCFQSVRRRTPPARPMAAPRARSRPAPRARHPWPAPARAPCRRHRGPPCWRNRKARASALRCSHAGRERAHGFSSRPVSRRAARCVPGWGVGQGAGQGGSRGWKGQPLEWTGGRSPFAEVLAEGVSGAFARDEDDAADGGVAPHQPLDVGRLGRTDVRVE